MPSLFTVVTEPNRVEPPAQVLSRTLARVETPTNNAFEEALDSPRETLPYRIFLESRATIRALEAWFASVAGMFGTFYIPTYVADMPLAAAIGASDTTVDIAAIGYTATLFPSTARRRLAFITASGIIERVVTAAVDNGDGTETLTLASSLGVAFPATGLVSFSLLVRLASDVLTITRQSATVGECVLACIEVPAEA